MSKKTSDKKKHRLRSMNYDIEESSKSKTTNSPFVDNSTRSKKQSQFQNTADNSPRVEQAAQLKATMTGEENTQLQEEKSNDTGLPDQLKSGVEKLSGLSMDDVKVHRNSSKPAQLQAEAYAQGSDIHLAPGKEKHLAHETWHVAQQKQGRVKPTMNKGGTPINDSPKLEREADSMGAKAAKGGGDGPTQLKALENATATAQLFTDDEKETLRAKATPPTDEQIDDMDRFTLAQTEELYTAMGDWAAIAALKDLARSSADIVTLKTDDNPPTNGQLVDMERFTNAQLTSLNAELNDWQAIADLKDLNRSSADIVTLKTIANPPTNAQLVDLERFTNAQLNTLNAELNDWQAIANLRDLARSSADLVTLHTSDTVEEQPTAEELTALEGKSNANILALYAHKHDDDDDDENKRIWNKIIHSFTLAEMDREQATTLDKANALANADNAKEKEDDDSSCWSWATQGFGNPAVPESTIWNYFSHRTNVPAREGGRKNHADAVAAVAGGNADVVAYLNRNEARINAIIEQWEEGMMDLDGEGANQHAQLELMRIHLAESGFNVLNQGANADWYICMHERKDNVGWEHWWIKTQANNIIETFPGSDLNFLDTEVNGGGDEDFKHEVPVADILPSQRAMIEATFHEKRQEIRQLLGLEEEEEEDNDD